MILKIRSGSYKLNQLLIVYIYISLVWIRQLVQKKPGTQKIPSPPREGDKKHMPTYESRCRVYFASCTKLHMPLVWSKLPNFSSKSTDLVQHPAWINPEVTVYVMVKFKPCSYELAYVWLTSTEVSSRSIVGTKSAKLQHVHSLET